jgi:FeoB-associated Cys-rich membrane protein
MLESLIIGAIVLGAVFFIARRVWRTIAAARAPKGAGCDSGCGCAPTATSSPERR